ncbi:hypothetical protein ACQ86N_00035 [Puia sp. P3]|uniref:hypothetical protein n=1 Tax=Puia sp. P3 TaxID=3423952 RepID=UPI003D664686
MMSLFPTFGKDGLQAFQLAAEVLGRIAIDYVAVQEVSASNPGVVALILDELKRSEPVPRTMGFIRNWISFDGMFKRLLEVGVKVG